MRFLIRSLLGLIFFIPVLCIAKDAGPFSESMGAAITRTLLALLFVLALIFLLVYLLKRFSPRWLNLAQKGEGNEEEIKILAVRALAPKRTLYLLRIGKHQVLIGSSEQGFERLGNWDLEDQQEEKKTRAASNSET